MTKSVLTRVVLVCTVIFCNGGLIASVSASDPVSEYLSRFPENGSLLEKWVPPEGFNEKFVYYLCGYTEENVPVWVAQWGTWDVKSVLESDDKELKSNYDKYVDQMGVHFFKSIQARSTPEDPITEMVFIIDMDNFATEQLASASALRYNLQKLRQLVPIAKAVDVGFIVNTNYVAETVVNLARPIFGASLANFQIYGTNKDVWIPRLLKEVPRSILPERYGGTKDFKPLKSFG